MPNDRYVTGGVHWNGYSLESLIKMVAERSNPGQLDALAGEWSRHGQAVTKASEDLQRSLSRLMKFWSGESAGLAARQVTTNARWIGELGDTAQEMSGPIQDAGGALRSAQDTMPGMPKNHWWATAGGGAAAGFAVGGPVGAAFGAAIGGIASAFGFGSSKRKMKRKAVQTMQRYEGALLGIDQTTPQFGAPTDGTDPGDDPIGRPGPGIDDPGGVAPPPGAGPSPTRPGLPLPDPVHLPNDPNNLGTDPAFTATPEGRWQSLTGLGTGGGQPPLGGGGSTGPGLSGGIGPLPGGLGGRGPGMMGGPVGAGRGGGARGGAGRGAGRGGGGYPGGFGGGRGDREYRGRGRFSRAGALGRGGYGIGSGAPGSRSDEESDNEHRRRVPIEEDPFSSADIKAAPPVIGL